MRQKICQNQLYHKFGERNAKQKMQICCLHSVLLCLKIKTKKKTPGGKSLPEAFGLYLPLIQAGWSMSIPWRDQQNMQNNFENTLWLCQNSY